ncbi:HAD family hydrolase [Microbacterium sp. zg.B48]|uniref:HAD family hydrolase n=1 Tax=Microbacterium sp. zg.B48 TaxID=2969408 RepID=UPI00214B8F38|nr:HAD family hydrolase [Microbacterium sp. zg.B48]MCR2764374.1 HAD family hydrolase [Microbacterium sp. zg.B48]
MVSFDIDGTLEIGDPKGPVTLGFVSRLREAGLVIGSCSDRTIREQRELWEAHAFQPDFTVNKAGLPHVRLMFSAAQHIHIGDTEVDRHYAQLAGFEFWWPWDVPAENDGWPPRNTTS